MAAHGRPQAPLWSLMTPAGVGAHQTQASFRTCPAPTRCLFRKNQARRLPVSLKIAKGPVEAGRPHFCPFVWGVLGTLSIKSNLKDIRDGPGVGHIIAGEGLGGERP